LNQAAAVTEAPTRRDSGRLRHLIFFLCAILSFGNASATDVDVSVRRTTPLHVYPAGEKFAFDVTVSTQAGKEVEAIFYQWRDFRGEPLGPKMSLSADGRTTIRSPSNEPPPGYLGLTFLADNPTIVFNESTGSRSEFGFVVLSSKSVADRRLNAESPFGLVHADPSDPYVPTWIKTLTWNTTGPAHWRGELQQRRDAGLLELPMISGKRWVSDGDRPVSTKFLETLHDRFREYITADPAATHWELGREENLSRRFEKPAYFANLAAKAAAIRNASEGITDDLRLIYQIGGRSLSDAKSFLASEAAVHFNILAPHPYFWPDFPAPEKWLEQFIDQRREAMQENGVDMPMWFTEIGAPQNDAAVAQMLSGDKPVRGHRRDENAAWLVRTHVISLAAGIEKIFWYNYADRDPSTTDVEDHFGLVDYWGFPKPSYAAYVNMTDCLDGKTFSGKRELAGGLRVYEFSGDSNRCIVAWTYPESTVTASVSSLIGNESGNTTIRNTVGFPIDISESLAIDGYPVLLTVRANTPEADRSR